MTSPLVSVIIPTRDRAELLRGTIAAIEAQTYPGIEIIVVDDGSRDDTPEVLQEAAARNPRIRSLRQDPARGAAAARNAGAAIAQGELFLFEDDDCRGQPERIALLAEALSGAPHAAYAYCFMASRNTDESITMHDFDEPWAIGTPYALIRAEAFRAVGGFDPSLPRLQDFDLWTRLLAHGRAVGVPRVLFETVRDAQGISASATKLSEASARILAKYRNSDLPRRHLASMHRRIAGALLMNGLRAEGLAHFRRAIRLHPTSLRSWLGLVAAGLGRGFFRRLVGLQARLARRAARRRAGGQR